MKYLIGTALALMFTATAYFVLSSDTAVKQPDPVQLSATNPFLNPEPVEIPPDADRSDYAKKLFAEARYREAVSVAAQVSPDEAPKRIRASAMILAGQALMQINDAPSRRYAREAYQMYLGQFPKEAQADAARYGLGLIALEDSDAPGALMHFTSLLRDYPDSAFSSNAAFFSSHIATFNDAQNDTLKGQVLRFASPFLPSNPAALVAVLTSLASVLVWFLFDWESLYQKLFVKKDRVVWLLLAVFAALATTNYVFENRRNAKLMLDATKALAILKR